MIAKSFIFVASRFPKFKRFFWRPVYNLLAKRFPVDFWQFMNYGYAPPPDTFEPPLSLPATYEFQRFPLQMYHYLALKDSLEGKHVLEVGSGRGGGANYLYHHFHPVSYTGIDYAAAAIKLCRELHRGENLRFICADAEKLPFDKEQFDVVLSVEASTFFPNFLAFLLEAKRVLKPHGKLLLADFRLKREMAGFETSFKKSGLVIVSSEDISSSVQSSLDKLDEIYSDEINRNIPKLFRGIFKQFAAGRGSAFYEELKSGERRYFRLVLQKT